MIRMVLLLAVIGLGADALWNNGAYTQAAWQRLSSYELKLSGPERDPKVTIERRS
jgi:hypothetical protein